MKNRDIIREIKKEAKVLVPDMKSEIISSLPHNQAKRTQRERPIYKRPVFAVAVIVVCVAVALLMTYIFYNPQEIIEISDSYVSVDINPSIELTADKNDIVKAIRPMNADAAVLIFGEDFSGMNIEDACEKIIALAVDTGYIDADGENAIKIVGINDNQQHETALSNKIAQKVQAYLSQNSISANISATGNPSKEVREEAKQHGVTVGKMELIRQLREKDANITFDEAKKKSVKELNQLLKDYDEDTIENLLSEFETEYEQAEQENLAELQQEITAIENRYAAIMSDVGNILSTINEEEEFATLQSAVNSFNSAYPEHKFTGKISVQRRNQIKNHFENLSETLRSSLNTEKNEKQNNATKQTRQQLKNRWKNQYNSN